MKWFKHFSDAHNNLKFQNIWDNWKLMGYGLYWLCCELVANEVDWKKKQFSVSKRKNWMKRLGKISSISRPTLEKMLHDLAEENLISKKALKIGVLSIPKMKERIDEYTEDMARKQRATNEQLAQEEEGEGEGDIDKKKTNASSFKKPKRFFKGEEMRFSKNKWWVLPKDGSPWLEFTGSLKDTEEK